MIKFVLSQVGFALVLLLFVALESVSFWLLDPSGFQRLGSVLVAVAIVPLVFSNRVLLHISDKYSKLSFKELDAISELRSLPASNVEVRIKLRSAEEHFRDTLEDGGVVDQAFEFARNRVLFLELTFAVIGTLQWGYGDLFHCMVNGNGWRVCY